LCWKKWKSDKTRFNMDYEKKQRLIALRNSMKEYGYADGVEELESIFPELRESEDERIRRTLAEYFSPEVQLDFVRGVPIRKIRDWLEKQKEQKPAQHLPKEKVYDIMRNLTALSYSERIPINSDEYGWIHKITEDVRSLLDYPIEQKPAEIDEYKIIKKHITEDSLSSEVNKRLTECGWYVSDQKQEWSEEDEKMWKKTQKHLEDYIREFDPYHSKQGRDVGVCLSWLKSLRPRPRWKPTEEQPEVFDTAAFQLGVQEGRRLEREDAEHLRDATKKISEDLEEAKEEYLRKARSTPGHEWMTRDIEDAFKAGAEWAASYLRYTPKKVSEDLEEAAIAFVGFDMDCDELYEYETGIAAFKEGAEWQKRKIMEGAVEGEVCILPGHVAYVKEKNNESLKQYLLDNFKAGDEVRIIILPNDEDNDRTIV